MAILLQYNAEDVYTVQQLTDSTHIKIVSRALRSLIQKVCVCVCVPDEVSFMLCFQDILSQVLQILLKSKLLVGACALLTWNLTPNALSSCNTTTTREEHAIRHSLRRMPMDRLDS